MKRIIVKSFLQDAKNTGSIPSVRSKMIEASENTDVSAEFPVNKLADTLHPVKFPLTVKAKEIRNGFAFVEFMHKDGEAEFYFKGGQYLGIRYRFENKELFSALPVLSTPGEKTVCTAFTKEYDSTAFSFFEGSADSEITGVSFEGHMNYSGIRDRNGAVVISDCFSAASAVSFMKTAEKIYGSADIKVYIDCENNDMYNSIAAMSGGSCIRLLSENELPAADNKTLFITGNYEFCEKYFNIYKDKNVLIKKYPVNTVREYETEKHYSIKVHYRDRVFEACCREGEVLSAALLNAGIPADIRCADGECGYCRMRLLSGEVSSVLLTGDRRTKADAKYGFIHPCSVTPVSNLILEL